MIKTNDILNSHFDPVSPIWPGQKLLFYRTKNWLESVKAEDIAAMKAKALFSLRLTWNSWDNIPLM